MDLENAKKKIDELTVRIERNEKCGAECVLREKKAQSMIKELEKSLAKLNASLEG